jgi:hypothetical protein
MSMSTTSIKLDPDEGPTVWAEQLESNPYTYRIVEKDRDGEVRNKYLLSKGEIERLHRFVQRTSET